MELSPRRRHRTPPRALKLAMRKKKSKAKMRMRMRFFCQCRVDFIYYINTIIDDASPKIVIANINNFIENEPVA